MGNRSTKDSKGVMLPFLEVLGGETLSSSGVATLPTGVEIIQIAAEGGAVYYSFSPIATVNSPGYVADGQRAWEGTIRDLNNFSVNLADGASAHLTYYRENTGR